MNIINKRILLVSPQAWGDYFVSKHHYAKELSKNGNQVYFLNPPNNIIENKINVKNIDSNGNLFIIDYLDFSKGKRFMPAMLNGKLIRKQINNIEGYLNINFDILWNFETSRFFNMSYLRKDILKILHLVDYNSTHNIKLASKTADICFCTTDYLKNKLLKFNINSFKINHGWQGPIKSYLNSISNSNKIKIGYLGNLTIQYIDWNLIYKIISQHENIEFYFFGPRTSSHLSPKSILSNKIITKLSQLDNVFFYGPIRSDEIYGYLKQMDANIIVYTPDKHKEQLSNPHKIMEYLGSGKIIISTYTDELKYHTDMVEMSNINSDYVNLFKQVINNLEFYNSSENQNKRITYAQKHLYQRQLEKIFHFIKCLTI